MKTLKLHEAKAHLSELIDAVVQGEEIIISRHGKPVAKLTGLAAPGQRELGFYPMQFRSDLLEPTDDGVMGSFYGDLQVRLLLDTHTFAQVVGDPSLLGKRAHALLLDPENELLVSPASIWEMSIKHWAGRWPEVAPFMDEQRYAGFTQRLGVQELPVRVPHARLTGQFNLDHKDPFDRLLAAQALLEGIPLVSKDAAFDRFPITRLW